MPDSLFLAMDVVAVDPDAPVAIGVRMSSAELVLSAIVVALDRSYLAGIVDSTCTTTVSHV